MTFEKEDATKASEVEHKESIYAKPIIKTWRKVDPDQWQADFLAA